MVRDQARVSRFFVTSGCLKDPDFGPTIAPMIDVLDIILSDLAAPIGASYVGRIGHESWRILFDDPDEAIEIEYAPERRLITIVAELAAPGPESREALYHLALQYNYLWTETGGARLSLDGPDGLLVLSVDIAFALIEPVKIAEILGLIRRSARDWRALIAAPKSQPQDITALETHDWRRV